MKKIELETNRWGDIFEDSDWNKVEDKFSVPERLTPALKAYLRERGVRIYTRILEWGGSKRYPKPIKENLVQTCFLDSFESSKAGAKVKEKIKKEMQKKKKATKIANIRENKNTKKDVLSECDEIHSRFYLQNYLTKIMFKMLKEPNEAHIDWLNEALRAFIYSKNNGGIMSDWMKAYRQHEVDHDTFYPSLCRAISAHRRHTETPYDLIDKRGMSEEQVDALRADMSDSYLY